MNAPSPDISFPRQLVGKSFLHPVFDYLLIGGGLSLLMTVVIHYWGDPLAHAPATVSLAILLFVNGCHFAASTVRLYSKPGAVGQLPFLTMLFPIVSLAVVAACLWWPDLAGTHLTGLYLTWSPYHYAAQAYGLAVMYTYRSGGSFTRGEKNALWYAAMMPFFMAFFDAPLSGLSWLLPRTVSDSMPALAAVRVVLVETLKPLGFIAPIVVWLWVWRRHHKPLPIMAALPLLANAVWWVILSYFNAFNWATIFHGLQYLAIIMIFHVRERTAMPDNRRRPVFHAAWFYLVCLALAYGLFQCLPRGFRLMGFGEAEAVLVTIVAINIHHFIVDGYIWRLKKTDGNLRIVTRDAAVPAAV